MSMFRDVAIHTYDSPEKIDHLWKYEITMQFYILNTLNTCNSVYEDFFTNIDIPYLLKLLKIRNLIICERSLIRNMRYPINEIIMGNISSCINSIYLIHDYKLYNIPYTHTTDSSIIDAIALSGIFSQVSIYMDIKPQLKEVFPYKYIHVNPGTISIIHDRKLKVSKLFGDLHYYVLNIICYIKHDTIVFHAKRLPLPRSY